jgi:hypothetical protein
VLKTWVSVALRFIASAVPWATKSRTPAYIFDV